MHPFAGSDARRGESEYNYKHFDLSNRTLDRLDGVQTGEVAPDFAATRLDGGQVRLLDYRSRVVVLETGSVTCPMYESRIESMNQLAQRFPDVAFLVLYTREAHPGEAIGPHRSMQAKTRAADSSPKATESNRGIRRVGAARATRSGRRRPAGGDARCPERRPAPNRAVRLVGDGRAMLDLHREVSSGLTQLAARAASGEEAAE